MGDSLSYLDNLLTRPILLIIAQKIAKSKLAEFVYNTELIFLFSWRLCLHSRVYILKKKLYSDHLTYLSCLTLLGWPNTCSML